MEIAQDNRAESVNPPYGEKGHFRKITITVPPEAYKKLVEEAARRKIAKEPNHLLSSLLREAVSLYMRALENMTESTGVNYEED